MDKQEKYSEDILSQFISPESIERAPEGFTSKIMTLIEADKVVVYPIVKQRKRAAVPYIFSAFIIGLILITVFLPVKENKLFILPALDFLKNMKLTFPEIDLGKIFTIDFSSTIIYGLIGILLLTFLDKALYIVFHREK